MSPYATSTEGEKRCPTAGWATSGRTATASAATGNCPADATPAGGASGALPALLQDRQGPPRIDRRRDDDVGEDLGDVAGAHDAEPAACRSRAEPRAGRPVWASLSPSFSIVMQNGQAVATVAAPVASA